MSDGKIHIPARRKQPVDDQMVVKVTPEAYNALVEIYNESTLSLKQIASLLIVKAAEQVVYDKNYLACDDANIVRQYIKRIAEVCPGVKVIVVDTVNGLMVADEMRRSKEKGYDKWVDLAACVWDLVCEAYTYRDDLTIIFTAHTQTDHDEAGYMFTRIKTSGKKLDKICLESKFTTVLLSKCVDGAYKFETQANNSTAKSPMGAFDQMEIDNDIVEVMKALEEY